MNARSLPVAAVLTAGVGMGVAGDLLLRAPGGPGLNFTLLFVALAGAVLTVTATDGTRPEPEALAWLGVGVLFGAALVWRGSEFLRFIAFVSASAAFAFAALRGGRGWLGSARLSDVAESLVGAGLHAGLGSLRLLQSDGWEAVGSDEARGAARGVARSVGLGLLLALVPLGVFGGLFISADPVFAGILSDLVRFDLGEVAGHVVLAGILTWLACGYLTGFWTGTRLEVLRSVPFRAPRLRIGEVAVALALVDLLFVGFVVVQSRVLFGGASFVEQTPDLTYAAYAREGFFQLVAATALGLPWLLGAHALVADRGASARWVFRGLAGTQLVLLLAIAASAAQRLGAYRAAYGLTEDRIVAGAGLAWLVVLVVWFGLTVLRGRRTAFTVGALVTGFGLVAALQILNPAARAATDLLDRAAGRASVPGGTEPAPDAAYLSSLGSDATPILLARLDELPPTDRCRVAERIWRRSGPDRATDWRSWNRADRRAAALVATEAVRVRAAAEAEICRVDPVSADPPPAPSGNPTQHE